MSTLLLGGLILSLSILLAVLGLLIAQHRIPLESRQSHNVPIGVVYGAVSVTFGVIIGFSAYLVLNKYTTSQTTEANEAADVRALYYLGGQLPQPQRDQIQDGAISYGRAVVDEEWPLMSQGQSSPRAAALNQEITKNVGGFAPSTSPEQTLYSQALQRTHELNQNRTLRLLYASKGLPPILWFVLGILGNHDHTFLVPIGNGECPAAHIGSCGINSGARLHHVNNHRTRQPLRRRSAVEPGRIQDGVK